MLMSIIFGTDVDDFHDILLPSQVPCISLPLYLTDTHIFLPPSSRSRPYKPPLLHPPLHPPCLHTSSVHHPRHDTICSPRPPHSLRRMGSHRLGKKTATLHHSTIPPQATALRLDLHTIVLSTFDIVQCPLEMLPRILQPTRTIRGI